jgi:hypothetical protein
MIVVRVELHSVITGKVTEIARAHIANIGGTKTSGDYQITTFKGRRAQDLNRRVPVRSAVVMSYPRLSVHVWHLVARALIAMGYAGKEEQLQKRDDTDTERAA